MRKVNNKTEVLSECDNKKAISKAKESIDEKKHVAKEIDGPKGLEPTRYGDWESKGRCHDF